MGYRKSIRTSGLKCLPRKVKIGREFCIVDSGHDGGGSDENNELIKIPNVWNVSGVCSAFGKCSSLFISFIIIHTITTNSCIYANATILDDTSTSSESANPFTLYQYHHLQSPIDTNGFLSTDHHQKNNIDAAGAINQAQSNHIENRNDDQLNRPIRIDKVREIIEEFPKSAKNHIKQKLYLNGSGFRRFIDIKPTFSDVACDYTVDSLEIIKQNENNLIVSLDQFSFNGNYFAYLCITDDYDAKKLRHLGNISKFQRLMRKQRSSSSDGDASGAVTASGLISNVHIEGFRIEHSGTEPKFNENGIPSLLSGSQVLLRIFGTGFTDNTVIAFTQESNVYGGTCLLPTTKLFRLQNASINDKTALVNIIMPSKAGDELFFCAKNDYNLEKVNATVTKPLLHQGSETWLRLSSFEPLLPLWASVTIIVVCLGFSALFSGLNLGLMALDRTELKILLNTGTDKERKYARQIQPVRDHGNYLLCSILLGNVLVNSTFTILLDGLTSGLIAVIFSTFAIVIFGEITPQAICSRHGLAVGAKTIIITKAIMVLTFPLSWPTSKLLDKLLGEEIGNVYNRERLKELVRVTTGINDLDKDEVNIISGALELRKKTVGDVMTHIEDAFMLCLDATLDFETVSEIMKSGFSRVPVYESDRKNIVSLLYIKDLAFVDPDDNRPLKTLCEFYQNPCHFVFEDVTLDFMFKQFKEGHKGHMAFVHRVNNEGDGDPFYETIGLITLEDVIEELIQAEIVDETDVFTDNRTKVRRQRAKKQDFTIFAERRDIQGIRISPQLTLATFQYLSTTVNAFKLDMVSETILRRLLNQDIVHHLKCKGKEKNDPSMLIYQQGKAVDFFVLILEGRVEVTVGKENLVFESGPFTYFGTQALVQNVGIDTSSVQTQTQLMGSLQSLNMDAMLRHTFVPDYSVRAVTDVIYIAIKRTLYLAAKRATLMERSQKVGETGSEPIDDEVEKLLHSLDEDDQSIGAHTADLNANSPRNQSKRGSNTPSPTFHAVSIDLKKRLNQLGQKNDLVMYAKEIIPNGPTPVSPNSVTSALMKGSASILNGAGAGGGAASGGGIGYTAGGSNSSGVGGGNGIGSGSNLAATTSSVGSSLNNNQQRKSSLGVPTSSMTFAPMQSSSSATAIPSANTKSGGADRDDSRRRRMYIRDMKRKGFSTDQALLWSTDPDPSRFGTDTF